MNKLLFLIIACCCAFPQYSVSQQPNALGPPAHVWESIDQSASAQSDENNTGRNKQQKNGKKSKKKKSEAADDENANTFTEAAANQILGQLRDALEGHSQRLMISAFDENKIENYLSFADQLAAFFDRYETFRVHFRILQAAQEEAKGVLVADIEIEEIPRGAVTLPIRKHDEVRFEVERGQKGWKIVNFRPRDFFS